MYRAGRYLLAVTLLAYELDLGQQAPCRFGKVHGAMRPDLGQNLFGLSVIDATGAVIENVTHRRIELVGGLVPAPVHRLARIVLDVAGDGNLHQLDDGVREVRRKERVHRESLASVVICWETHLPLHR